MTKPTFRTFALIVVIFFVAGLTIPAELYSHGGNQSVPTPAPGEEWEPKEPLDGSGDFIELLGRETRAVFTEEQLGALDRAVMHSNFAAGIRSGRYPGSQAADAEYNRQKSEDALLELLGSYQDAVVLDFYSGGSLPDPEKPVVYTPATETLLLKVMVSEGPINFRSQVFDLNRERYAVPYTVSVAPEGTTWVLLQLEEVPGALSKTGIAFVKEGEESPFRWHAITFDVEPLSHLRLQITDDEGKPSPALLQIKEATGGRLWPIEDHQDFRPLLHDVTGPESNMPPGLCIYGPHGSLRIPISGEFSGYYWLVSSSVEVSLPAGDWIVTAMRGVEFNPWQKKIRTASGAWTEEELLVSRWTDMASRGWYSGDDHVHSRMMNSADAQKLMNFAKTMDIRVANILEMGDPQKTFYSQRGFGGDFRVQDDGYWLVPGQEDPRSMLGHNIGLNLQEMARDLDRYLQLDWIASEVHRQGGLFGQTHVGQNTCFAHRGMALMVPHEIYDFYSLMQGGIGFELYYDFLDLGYKLPASAGSDMPYGGAIGDVRVYTFIGKDKPFTPDAWFESLRRGHTFTTNGPMLEFNVDGHLPGEEIVVSTDKELSVYARAWGSPNGSAPQSLEIIRLGEQIEVALAASDGPPELTLETKVEPGDGYWIAARAWGRNGSVAHSTPIYVKRPGLRHWNLDRVEEVVEKELAVLDEIEGVIAGVEEMEENGTLINLDFGSVGIAREKEEVRALLSQSRATYEELRTEAREQVPTTKTE